MRAVATPSELEKAVVELIQSLSREIRVECVILYGSYVGGKPDEWSDFDIAIVSPDFEGLPLWRRQQILARLSVHCHPRLSSVGYPSSEYKDPTPGSFLAEIIRTGRVVWRAKE
ncbi:MAG: nucleotidyltransferase domain-containing protein [Chloroflexi bacterium]|nr:nucleotidyltransferase domain-containing protein [Chloroflexota bacterium]